MIEPADIGGKWGDWDDRSTFYRGYGRIEEGDLNLTVAKILERNLQQLGAKVFLTRQSVEPVAAYDPQKLDAETREILARQSYTLPPAFYERARNVPKNSERRFEIAVAGRQRISIFREYASNVTAGLADAYSANRKDR